MPRRAFELGLMCRQPGGWPRWRAATSMSSAAAPVSNIAFELGFEDPACFRRFFKRHVGAGPREYRDRSRGRSASA
ncbi:helix-turn-helix domain-containing protein [Variovorax sp. YR752]|uniref:helix-turn-helix domain-containing protein n=1 Tax=Variovorax sp. YR752 TaxID=1884383 RepID=UPI003137F686